MSNGVVIARALPRYMKTFYVEYPPMGLWIGDCEIYPQTLDEHSCIHRCGKHIIIAVWGWVEHADTNGEI